MTLSEWLNKMKEEWNEADPEIKFAIGTLVFVGILLFLGWCVLWAVAPAVAVWVTAITAIIVLFIAVCIAFAILADA